MVKPILNQNMITNQVKKNLPLWIAVKFIFSSLKTKYTKIIMSTTIIGITLGITILLTVLSIMNGFSYAAKNRFINLLPNISINIQDDFDNTLSENDLITIKDYKESTKLEAYQRIIKNKIGANKIKNMYPSYQDKAFIISNQKLIPIYIMAVPAEVIESTLNALGIDLETLKPYKYLKPIVEEAEVKKTDEETRTNIITEKIQTTKAVKKEQEYFYKGIIASSKTLSQTNNPKNISISLNDNLFKIYNLDISASFNASDNLIGNIAIVDIEYLKQIAPNKYINKLNIDLVNPYAAQQYTNELLSEMTLSMSNWTQYVGNYFNILEYTKQVMFILLSLIILVAMFNAVANLTTTLNEKQTEIAILKTIGADKTVIVKLVLLYGLIITTIGLILGLLCGSFLSLNIPYIAKALEYVLGYKFVNSSVYFIDYLPSKIAISDMLNITLFVYFIMFITAFYPVKKACSINITNTLKSV